MKQAIDKKAFGKALKTKRIIEKELTVREAADEIGTSSATVWRMENGKESTMENFIRGCNWLGVSACDFIVVVQPKTKRNQTKK